MKPQNELALVVAYYLSQLDKEGITNLGYKTFNEAANDIGRILDVKPRTVTNMRDEFDYHMQNGRIGWRRELKGSRLKVFQTFQMTDDNELTEIIKEILTNTQWTKTDSYQDLRSVLSRDQKDAGSVAAGTFVLRGPTGRKAEQYFAELFDKEPFPVEGQLVDCRDLGCGYDYEIRSADDKSHYVEIKGLAGKDGGILFTDKEWRTAKKHKDSYYVVIIAGVSGKPSVRTIQNPAAKLTPSKNIYTTIQVSWSVSKNALQGTQA